MNLPQDVANQALDAAGVEHTLGDLEEGTRTAQVTLRAYGQCLRQLHRAAHWDFARKQMPLVLLADASGQNSQVGSIVPVPWAYEYAYPIDCMKVRFIPWNYGQIPATPAGNIAIPTTIPLTTGMGQQPMVAQRLRPARFVIATDPNYPPPPQMISDTQGESPQGRTVILTNVKEAQVIYTALMIYPSVWDALFREAMVAVLASVIALPLARDKNFGMKMRKENIEIAKAKIKEARVVDGNESVASSDLSVDWMRARGTGGWGTDRGGYGGGDFGGGGFGGGYDSMMLADGSVF